MSGEADYHFYISIGTLVTMVGVVAGGIMKFFTYRDEVLKRDEDMRLESEAKFENVARDIQTLQREGLNRTDTMRHETGEMGAALRQKIHEIEVYTRDTFVSKATFETVINRIETMIDKLGDRLEKKLDRIAGHDK